MSNIIETMLINNCIKAMKDGFNSLSNEEKHKEFCKLLDENIKLRSVIKEAKQFNNHLIKDCKYRLNEGHLRSMKKILSKEVKEDANN